MSEQSHQILLLNGPNLNLLGSREPSTYGTQTLDAIVAELRIDAARLNVTLSDLQSNAEHELIDRIHAAQHDGTDAIVINPAAFTHTSIAMRDALVAVALPLIEVHLSNIHARENFRHKSFFSDIAIGSIIGLGAEGYTFALQAIVKHLRHR